MTLEQEISKLVRERLMEEINGLGIRAAIREQIEESGITKGKVAELVEQTVDSYVRSINIEALVDKLINRRVETAVKDAIEKYVVNRYGSYNGTALLEKIVKDALYEEWRGKYTARVDVVRKEGSEQ